MWRSYHYWGCVEVDHGVCCSSSAALLVLGSRGTLGRGCSLWQASAGCFPWYGSTRPPTHPPARTRMSSSPDPAQGCSSELFRWRFVLIGRRRLNLESWRCSGSGPGPWNGGAGVALEVEEDASQCVAPSALQSLLWCTLIFIIIHNIQRSGAFSLLKTLSTFNLWRHYFEWLLR